jgi:penicillin-binding protein 2
MDKYLKTTDNEWYKQRVFGIMLCALVAFIILLIRLVYLQVIMGEEFRRLSLNNSIRLQSIDPPRGLIFDRHGKTLVENRPSFDVSIILKDAGSLFETIDKLALYLDASQEELMSKISKNKGVSAYKPILLKQDIGRDALAEIEVHKVDLPGVGVHVKLRRYYLNKDSAAHLLGYLSEINPAELKSGQFPGRRRGDYIGKYGVEKVYENYLRGERGGRQVEVNANGQTVRILKTVSAKPGQNVFLTIDQELQQKAETLLDGVAGAVVAIEPDSGRVLAIASSPSFNQNYFVDGMSYDQWDALISNPFRPLENKAIQGEYPPGSTYKIVTSIAGLEEGIIDENTTVYCPGYYKFGNRVYRCWKKGGHGQVDFKKAMTESCDVYFYQVGQKLGVDRLAWYAKACGLGSATGIKLDKEAQGLIPTAAWKKRRVGVAWQKGETLSLAIGQGFNLATPLQMALLAAAVANGGIRYQPTILAAVKNNAGQILAAAEPKISGKLPASQHTLNLVREGLWRVVNAAKGTAGRIRLNDFDISGKTGTSQVISRKSYDPATVEIHPAHLKPHAWFVAYGPSESARIAVAVLVEHGEHGSSGAAPVAGELIKYYLRRENSGSRTAKGKEDSTGETSG